MNIPIVILVNENSASASELFAATLQEHDIATVIGEVTYGKGTVQTQHILSNGGGVRVTIAEWLTPEHNSIEGSGVQPNIVVTVDETAAVDDDESDAQLNAALDYLVKVLRKAA